MIDGFNISRVHQHITHGSHLHKIPRKTLHLKIYNIIHKKLEKSSIAKILELKSDISSFIFITMQFFVCCVISQGQRFSTIKSFKNENLARGCPRMTQKEDIIWADAILIC